MKCKLIDKEHHEIQTRRSSWDAECHDGLTVFDTGCNELRRSVMALIGKPMKRFDVLANETYTRI